MLIQTYQIQKEKECQTTNKQIIATDFTGNKLRITLFSNPKDIGKYKIVGDSGLNEKKFTKLFKTTSENVFFGDTLRQDLINQFKSYVITTKDGTKKLNIKLTIDYSSQEIRLETRENNNSLAKVGD